MSNFEAKLNLRGSNYIVENIFMRDIKFVMPHDTFIPVPDEFALRLKNEVMQGKKVTIPKKVADKKKQLIWEDFKITGKSTDLDEKKRALKARANSKTTAYTAMLSALDLYNFFMIMTRMASLGFNVLDEQNKEEVYLNIINTGDEHLIEDLELFLESKERFDKISRAYNGMRDYFREIDACTNAAELKEVADEYNGWLSE